MTRINRRQILTSGLLLSAGAALQSAGAAEMPAPDPAPAPWPNSPPPDCPFPRSRDLHEIRFTGRHREYTNADTWFPTWAADGELYSPWTDGYILEGADGYRPFDESHPAYACNSLDFMGRKAATGQARLAGSDPLHLTITNLKPRIEASPAPFGGRYPCGSLVYKGVWYYGTYCLANAGACGGVGWTEMGPFVGFRQSHDLGVHWKETRWTPSNPLFGEDPARAKVRIGSPHFVDFGRELEHSPDGHAYLAAHGASQTSACSNWIQGDEIYLLRVKPSSSHLDDPAAFQFYAGQDSHGRAVWASELSAARPLIAWPGRFGCVTITFNAPLRRFLMCITRGIERGHHDTMILESTQLTGPWSLVHFLRDFGPEAYFVNIPGKFISADGRSMWLCYSANWSDKQNNGKPFGSRYALCLHEFTL